MASGGDNRVVKQRLVSVLALALGAAAPVMAASWNVGDASALVDSLEHADYGQRADFARLALDEVIASYAAVAEGVSGPARSLGGKTDLRRWRVATDAFVNQLRDARLRLDRGAEVQLTLGSDGIVVMFIDRRPVLLSGPDAVSVGALQQTVMAQFCSRHACAAAKPMPFGAMSDAVDADAGGSHWTFAQNRHPSFVIGDGLRFVYANISQRAEKERVSRQLAAELQQLSRALQGAAESGRTLDWQRLRLQARHDGSLEQVILNGHGERLSLSLPLLARTPPLWREALPWLHAQVQGAPYALTLRQAYLLLDQRQQGMLYGASR